MNLLYDDDLLEEAVFLCASGRCPGIPALQIRRFHAEREKVYVLGDAEARNAAFFRVNLEWFREWGLEQCIADVLAQFPKLTASVRSLVFRKARTRTDEGAELYVSDTEGQNAVVALKPERFVANPTDSASASVESMLNHELMHLNDMVDPEFGYSPDIDRPIASVSQAKLRRERYRILWDITIDGRLTRVRRLTSGNEAAYQAEFDRAFSFLSAEHRSALFTTLWNSMKVSHAELMGIASDPRGLGSASEPVPGAACPLCRCSTFSWANTTDLKPRTIETIQRQFPGWTPTQGACARCTEIFAVLQTQNVFGPMVVA